MSLAINLKDNGRNAADQEVNDINLNAKSTSKGMTKKTLYRMCKHDEDKNMLQHNMRKLCRRSYSRKHSSEGGHGMGDQKYRLAAYCVSESIILDSILKTIDVRRLKTRKKWKIKMYKDVIHYYLEVREYIVETITLR